MHISPERSSHSIVLVGNLNPIIFKPSWFAKNGLISEEEESSADIELIHKDLIKFSLDWASITVESTRFIIESIEVPYVKILDLTLRTFQEFLSHTPLFMLGINKKVHFKAPSIDSLYELGNKLAPKSAWGEWGQQLLESKDDLRNGMRTLVMEQSIRDDREKGFIRAKIEPSTHVKYGIFMEINDHFEIIDKDNVEGTEEIITILSNNFESSLDRSEWIVNQIMKQI